MKPTFGHLDVEGQPRRGRPAKPTEQRLAASKTIKLTRDGLQALCRAADALGVSSAEFTRAAALERAQQVLDGDRA